MLIPYGVTGVTGVTGMTGFTGNATIAEYNEAAKMDATCHIRITFPQQGMVFTESDIESAGVDYDMILNGDSDMVFGRAVTAEFKTCLFMSGQTAQLVWENEFIFEVGMDVDEERTVWTKIGMFTGTRPDKVNSMGLIDFVACDRMKKFEILSDDWLDSLTYPMTLRQIYNSLCTYVGVQNVVGDELPAIMNRTYTEAPIIVHGMLCRDILALIAEAAGCYARITPDGYVKLVWYQDHTDYELDERDEFSCQSLGIHFANTSTTWESLEDSSWEDLEDTTWSDLEYYQQQLKIVALSVKQTEDDLGYTYPEDHADGNVYLIVDNPYLKSYVDGDIDDYMEEIFDRLDAFGGYLPMSVDCIGNPLIEPGDMITVSVHDDYVRMPIFYKSMNVTMGCADRYEATGAVKRAEVPQSVREELKDGGRRHIFRNDINELYSEIFDSNNMSRIAQNAQGIQQLSERKATVYYGPFGETGITGVTADDFRNGDLWIDTSDNNRILRYNGQGWGDASFSDNSKARIFKSPSAPVGTTGDPLQDGDIWVDTYNNAQTGVSHNYKMYTYDLENATWREVSPDKYTVQSGVDIEPDGVTIHGGKYVRILAGVTGETDGVFDVDTTNFKINSQEKLLQSGKWKILPNGIFNDREYKVAGVKVLDYGFQISHYDDIQDDMYRTGIRFQENFSISPVTGTSFYGGVEFFGYDYGNDDRITLPISFYNAQGDNRNKVEIGQISRTSTDTILYCMALYPQDIADSQIGSGVSGASSGWWNDAYINTVHYVTLNQSSSKEVKHDIKELRPFGEIIDKLVPVTYKYNRIENDRTHFGLIHEDTIDILPEICIGEKDDDADKKGICYTELIPILLKEVQELRKRVATLEEKVNELERK